MIQTLSTDLPPVRKTATENRQPNTDTLAGRPWRPLTPAAMHLRNLRYFHELLGIGYRCALHPDPFPRSLRGERIALGIDLAELDTIPLWSNRRSDGAVAIPMAGFILERFCHCVDAFCAALEVEEPVEPESLHEAREALRTELTSILPCDEDEKEANLARLADTYIPDDRLQRLCGQGGLLERILAACESLLGRTPEHA